MELQAKFQGLGSSAYVLGMCTGLRLPKASNSVLKNGLCTQHVGIFAISWA